MSGFSYWFNNSLDTYMRVSLTRNLLAQFGRPPSHLYARLGDPLCYQLNIQLNDHIRSQLACPE